MLHLLPLLSPLRAAGQWLIDSPGVIWEVPFLIWVCLELQHYAYRQSPLYSMFVAYMCFNCGSLLQLVVMGGADPDAPFSGIALDDWDAAIFLVTWFLIFYSKLYDVASSRLGLLIVSMMSSVGWARAVVFQFDRVSAARHGQLAAPFLSATCAGVGSITAMSVEAVLWNRPERHRLTQSLGASASMSFSLALIHYVCSRHLFVPSDVSEMLVVGLLLCWTVLGQLAGIYINPARPFELLFRQVVVLLSGPHHGELLQSFMVHGPTKPKRDATFYQDASAGTKVVASTGSSVTRRPRIEVTESVEPMEGPPTASLDEGFEEYIAFSQEPAKRLVRQRRGQQSGGYAAVQSDILSLQLEKMAVAK